MENQSRRGLIGAAVLLLGTVAAGCTAARQGARKAKAPAADETASGPAATAAADSVAARLETHVRKLSETFRPRDHAHPENLDRAAAYIQKELKRAGGRTTEQTFEVDGGTYRNVLAAFGPETPERLVVGAHYDAAGPHPAADDNASGVAGLIELAHSLAGTRLPLRIEMVAFTLEEPPHFGSDRMGSAVHAASLEKQGVRVRAMLSLEMIGYFSEAKNSQEYPDPRLKATYPSEGNFIAVVGRTEETALVERIETVMRDASPLPVRSLAAPASVPGIDLSDHRSYWDAGFPAVMITDTAYYRNPHYHTPGDTPETLDYARMAQVVTGVRKALLSLSE